MPKINLKKIIFLDLSQGFVLQFILF